MSAEAEPIWDVFLAHAGPDKATAEKLYELLVAAGKRVFLDSEALHVGDDWHLLIPDHQDASIATVVLLSASTRNAWYERAEVVRAVSLAREHGHRVMPVKLLAGAMSYGLEGLHALEAFDDSGLSLAAEQIIAALNRPETMPQPLARAVFSTRIPHVSRWFTGRDALLNQLVDAAESGGNRVLTQTISGLGGVGKTTIAAAFADAYKAQADIVWWVRADQDSTIIDDLVELAERVGLPAADTRTETAQRTVAWLTQTDRRWLVVFDNAKDERLLAPWVPKSGKGMSLITTRNRVFNQLGQVLDIDSLPIDVATQFLIDRVTERNALAAGDRVGAEVIANRLQGLPLALEQAGAWVASSGLNTFGRYLTLLNDVTKNPFPDGTVPLDYERSTWDSIQISVNAAAQRSPHADRLLCVTGWLAPDDIPVAWLTAAADEAYLDIDEESAIDALQALEQFSLVTIDGDHLNVHRVVQAAVRRRDQIEAGTAAVAVVRRQLPGDGAVPENWLVFRRLDQHIEHCHDHEAGCPATRQDIWQVRRMCATAVQRGGDPLAAVGRFDANLRFAETFLGDRHPHRLTARADLAYSYRSAGRANDAITLEEQVLVDSVEVLGERHPDTLTARANLASSYWSAGRTNDAITLEEQVLVDRVEILGQRHPDTLTTRANLATSYQSAGRTNDAITLQEQVLVDSAEILGQRHPDTLTARANLATSYQSAGRTNDAITLLEQVVVDRVGILGQRHPDTLTARANLTISYWTARRTKGAVTLLEQTIADGSSLDHTHPFLGSWTKALDKWRNP
jgi:tetratricopeptide (TPR) repeat protein